MSENYLAELNKAQRDAVEYLEGPSLVIAGAGSGKTRVLTYKIVHLLNNGFKPYTILALTFTNKAAREMKERIAKIIGEEKASQLWMGTFHSIFAKILRKESAAIGYPSNFTIYDTVDTKSMLKTIIKDLKLSDKDYPPGDVLHRISGAKNNLITAQVYATNQAYQTQDFSMRRPEIHRIYTAYHNRLRSSAAMDFDDLLLQTNILFRDNPSVLEKYQQKFNFILVDEYQDTNFSQYLIVKKIAALHHRVCIVGDDAQSIYSFRGAKIENIYNFQKDYPEHRLFKLEQNYRSTQTIVEAANSVIVKNSKQIKKEVFSKNEEGGKIKVVELSTDVEEGITIATSILDSRLREHSDYKDFAILYRTNAQSRIMEESLRRRNIPYKIYGGTSFYQRKEIKDVLAYFRMLVNPNDDEAIKRIINYPKRGIGDTTIDKISELANQHQTSMWKIILNLSKTDSGISPRTINTIHSFAQFIIEHTNKLYFMDAYKLACEITSASGVLKELYSDKTPEGVGRYENIQELLNGIKEFTTQKEKQPEELTLDKYMEDIALLTGDDNEKDEERNKVTLMTIHSAKGLEFKNVFIVGVEEGLFPSSLSAISETEVEEERRLFYVAVTRAEKNLTISYARMRQRWGEMKTGTPSRFIREIDPAYLSLPEKQELFSEMEDAGKIFRDEKKSNFTFKKPEGASKPSIRIKPETPPEAKKISLNNIAEKTDFKASQTNDVFRKIQNGMRVEHEKFGFGTVIAVEGTPPNMKATIDFPKAGQKQLLLKFAKLRLVE